MKISINPNKIYTNNRRGSSWQKICSLMVLVYLALTLLYSSVSFANESCLVYKYQNIQTQSETVIFGPGTSTLCARYPDSNIIQCKANTLETVFKSCEEGSVSCKCIMKDNRYKLANSEFAKNISEQLDTQILELKMELINSWSMQLSLIQNDINNINSKFLKLSNDDENKVPAMKESIKALNDSMIIVKNKICALKKDLDLPHECNVENE